MRYSRRQLVYFCVILEQYRHIAWEIMALEALKMMME